MKSLKIQGVITEEEDLERIQEIVFDYAPQELTATIEEVTSGRVSEPVPPRQYFPVAAPPLVYPPLPRLPPTSAIPSEGLWPYVPAAVSGSQVTSPVRARGSMSFRLRIVHSSRRTRLRFPGCAGGLGLAANLDGANQRPSVRFGPLSWRASKCKLAHNLFAPFGIIPVRGLFWWSEILADLGT